jgi:hypothetical protein
LIIIKDSSGNHSVILGTNGEMEIREALIGRINAPSISDSSKKECKKVAGIYFGIFESTTPEP